MGVPKALLRVGGGSFLARILNTLVAAGLDDIVVVTGAHDAEIRAELHRWSERAGTPDTAASSEREQAGQQPPPACDVSLRVVHNEAADADQLSSLRRGLSVVDHPGLPGALVTLVDHPFVSAATVRALSARFAETHAPVVRPRCAGRNGHPVVFGRDATSRLMASHAPASAKAVVNEFAARQQVVDVDDEGVWTDVDTPEDYEAALQRFGR